MNKCLSAGILCAAALLLASTSAAAYNDHRGHNLDSLERAVARWTPDAVDRASEPELLELNRAYRDLMLGYLELNGEKSMFYAHRALGISVPQGWQEANADAYRYLGIQFYGREQYDSALVYYRHALDAVEAMAAGATSPLSPNGYNEKEIDNERSALYGTIGNLYNVMGDIPEAMDWYVKAGEIFEKYGWNESNSVLYYNIGETWTDEGKLRQAAPAYRKALNYAEVSGDSLMIVQAYKGLGRLYTEQHRPAKALPYLQEAEKYYATHPDDAPLFRTENLTILSDVLARQKRQLAALLITCTLLLLLSGVTSLTIHRLRRARREQAETAQVMDETLEDLRRGSAARKEAAPELSDREKEILDLVAKGYTTQQIADALHLSYETIRWYRKKLLVKFDGSNTAELISLAKEFGLV